LKSTGTLYRIREPIYQPVRIAPFFKSNRGKAATAKKALKSTGTLYRIREPIYQPVRIAPFFKSNREKQQQRRSVIVLFNDIFASDRFFIPETDCSVPVNKKARGEGCGENAEGGPPPAEASARGPYERALLTQ